MANIGNHGMHRAISQIPQIPHIPQVLSKTNYGFRRFSHHQHHSDSKIRDLGARAPFVGSGEPPWTHRERYSRHNRTHIKVFS